MNHSLLSGLSLMLVMHTCIWFSTNLQLMSNPVWKERGLILAIVLAIPISLLAFYSTRLLYDGLNGTAWGVRLAAFGMSYVTFPVLTWLLLHESMFTPKTMTCIFLSLLIVLIQIFWR